MKTKTPNIPKTPRAIKIPARKPSLSIVNNRRDPLNKFDAVGGSSNTTGAGNKRRQAVIEMVEEAGAAGVLSNYSRLQAINLARDMERNYAVAKSLILQLRNNVVGALAKIQINTNDDFAKEANTWFNKWFFSNCDFRGTEDFSRLSRHVVTSKKREGDLLVVFDDGVFDVAPGGTGKIIFYEADQLAEIDNSKKIPKTQTQQAGVILDQYNREVGYVVSKKRGQSNISDDDAIIFSRDPNNEDANSVKLIKSTYRLNQTRGTADLLPSIATILDCYEMHSKELQSAKVAASMAGTITRKESVTDFDDARLDPENDNPDTDDTEATSGLPEDQETPATYERLESLTGGYMDYLAEGDEFKLHDINRPNVNMPAFIDHAIDGAGAALGFAHAYARMKADTSYTAFRGDMILTWVSLFVEQKDLEREWLDWIGVRAIRWALKTGRIKATPPEKWEEKYSWHLPVMPNVDELKERQANALALKNGEKDYSDILGPTWADKFASLAEQLNVARKLGLPLSVFEQKSGGMADESENKTEEDDTQETGDKENE